jgi:hypothetical protein
MDPGWVRMGSAVFLDLDDAVCTGSESLEDDPFSLRNRIRRPEIPSLEGVEHDALGLHSILQEAI